MRLLALVSFAAVVLLSAGSSTALEKENADRIEDHDREWRAGSSVTVSYYNTCNGWAWTWNERYFEPLETIGSVFEVPGEGGASLQSTSWFLRSGFSWPGYGFTGTLTVSAADQNNCPEGAPLQSQPFLPSDGWNLIEWDDILVDRFVIQYTLGPIRPYHYVKFYGDSPAGSPTGPQGCGLCYPCPRAPRSFRYGTADEPLCPPEPLEDEIGPSNLLVKAALRTPVALDSQSWTSLKALYR